MDGKTVDEKNYTVKEGSIVVTLQSDYVAGLSKGEHTVGIESESGTAATTFTVKEKSTDNNGASTTIGSSTPQNSSNSSVAPQTGDNSPLWFWIMILMVSGGALASASVYRLKRRR